VSDETGCGHDHVDTFGSGAGRRVDVCMGCEQAVRFWNGRPDMWTGGIHPDALAAIRGADGKPLGFADANWIGTTVLRALEADGWTLTREEQL